MSLTDTWPGEAINYFFLAWSGPDLATRRVIHTEKDVVMVATSVPERVPSDVFHTAQESGFDERWAAWQAKGAAHDARLHRRVVLVLAVIVAGLIVGVLRLALT